jgi:hypothetical protein
MAINHVLGKVPMIQVLDFMMEYMEYDCTIKEIIDHTGVGPTDMKRDFPGLVESGVVMETRKIGVSQLYRLNDVNVVTEALFELDRVLSDDVSVEITGEEEEEPETGEHLDIEVTTDANQTTGGEEEDPEPDGSEKYPQSAEDWES